MNSTHPLFRLNNKALVAAVISAAFPMYSYAAAAKVEFAVGGVTALNSDGRSRALTKGAEINAGDTIQTADGRAQVRFSDGGYISLQPNTEFKVEDYSFSGKADGTEKGFFNLVKGGLRAITGAIGHTNKQAYRVNTPVATIGIRGTEFLAQYDTKLLVKVGNGAVYMVNQGGDIILFKGQVGEVGSSNSKPQYSDDSLSVGAAGPSGSNPQQVQQEQQQQQQQQNTFTAGEVRTVDGTPCSIADGGECAVDLGDIQPAFSSVVQPMHAAGAYADYKIDALATNAAYNQSGTQIGAASTASSYLYANFYDYTASIGLAVSVTSGTSSGFYNAYASGSILSQNDGVAFNGSASGGQCYGSCAFTAAGFFSGANAVKAQIGYLIDGTNFSGTPVEISGTVGFTQTSSGIYGSSY
jgi:hypothetical protein